jgi:L,D-peptidoglycan transpeptidase YkuD (ErfK/YbiS/YcfS/YnhG family)
MAAQRRSRALTVAVVAALWCALVAVVGAGAASASSRPAQRITVQADSATSTTAQLRLWQRDTRGIWTPVWGPATAFVGALGVGATREGLSRTPAGLFGLTQAFGNRPNPGTRLPYFLANSADWWDGESGTPAYNTHVHQATSPGPASENLYYAGDVYSRAVVIDYNRFPVRAGMGSAFFLHVANGQPTAGCVSLPGALLDQVLRWLDPSRGPTISIGVGSAPVAAMLADNAAIVAHNPLGWLDAATAVAPGRVQVRGWAFDPDGSSSRLTVEVFADGRRVGALPTGVRRADVARHFGVGPNQGYQGSVAVPRGAHTVCVFADNIGTGSGNPRVGCRAVTVS